MYPHERTLVEEMQGRPFVLLGVNNDKELKTAKKAVKKNKLNWRSFHDGISRKITGKFKIKGYPTVMLIDHNGVIIEPNIRGKKLDAKIAELVAAAEDAGMSGEDSKIEPEMRTFRDKTGKHRIRAIAEAISEDKVRLRKEKGGTVEMELDNLSRSDQKYLATVALEDFGGSESGETSDAEYRTFVDSTGDHEVEAIYVGVEDGKVVLKKRNGSTVKLPIKRLSDEDQEFVKEKSK